MLALVQISKLPLFIMTESIQTSSEDRDSRDDDSSELLRMGFAHHQSGEFDQAQSHYEQALKRDPLQLDALQLLGVLLAQQGNPSSAIPYFEKAIALQPQQPGLAANCARAYFDLGEWSKARDHYAEVIRLTPDAIDALCGYGECQGRLGLFDEAISAYQKALSLNPELHEILAALAQFHRKKKDFSKALDCLYQALHLSPKQPEYVINQALLLSDLGRFNEALEAINIALENNPEIPDGWVTKGLIQKNLGLEVDALLSLDAALVMAPGSIDALLHKGRFLREKGDLEGGVHLFQQVLKIEPQNLKAIVYEVLSLESLGVISEDESLLRLKGALAVSAEVDPEILNTLGSFYLNKKQLTEALSFFDQALSIDHGHAASHFNRGTVLNCLDRFSEALASFNQAIELQPQMAEAHSNRVLSLMRLNRDEEALESAEQSILINPSLAETYLGMGVVLAKLLRFEEALSSFLKAISLRENYAEAYANRAGVLVSLGRLDEAESDLKKALGIEPNLSSAHNHLGILLSEHLQIDDALEAFDRAIFLDSGADEAHFNRALLLLLKGDLEEGFKGYEWRWKGSMRQQARDLARPLWLGESPLANKTLLVTVEQGFGDFIQYARFFPELAAQALDVTVEVPAPLLSLIQTMGTSCRWIKAGTSLPTTDFWCPLMSLPLALKKDLSTIPSKIPYIGIPPHYKALWAKKLGERDRPRIGLVWSGSAAHRHDWKRSIPLELFKGILDEPFEFHVLQKEFRAKDLALLRNFPEVQIHSDGLKDFADTAGLIEHMDLVISVDTSVAHLAGGLGRPVWLMVSYCPDFRWLINRSDSPWYPTMRLFRQNRPSDWGGVLDEVRKNLSQKASTSGAVW